MKMSNEMAAKRGLRLFAMIMVVTVLLGSIPAMTAHAQETVCIVPGAAYVVEGEDTAYAITSETADEDAELMGELSIAGDLSEGEAAGEYVLGSGSAVFSYSYDADSLEGAKEEWHLVKDGSKTVGDMELEDDVGKGAMILQTSLDGENWTEEWARTNVFADSPSSLENLYTTKYVQQQNGCYFKLIVVYEMERTAGSHKVAKVVDVDDKEYKKYTEVYTFYVADETTGETALSPTDTPRKELGKKINTGKDNGYSGKKDIDLDDPHYGWDIGTFSVNGYTRETSDGDRPVFLKNVGDKVTLWFRLEQDINKLDDSKKISVMEDKDGYDRNMEVPRTNFKRGTLIVRYTNEQGVTEEPVIYTDFLAANTKTGADTKVILFEEGDYEVSLDYEIKKSRFRIFGFDLFPTYNDYKVYFEFSIRNGNCMVYPFDLETGAELANNAVTPNGFRLDMARSRYLTIDVEQASLKVASDGTINKDVRANGPAMDGETYTDEGMYTFTVNNLYTGESTVKTIYVGTSEAMEALAKSGLSVDDWNKQVAEGR